MQKEKMTKKQKGITLIALVITIIVMLILVGVTVTVALNGGLFTTAKQATDQTQMESEKEQLLSIVMGAIGNNGKVNFSELDTDIAADGTFEGTSDGATKGTYTSKKSGNTYTINSSGSIALKSEEAEGGLPEGWTETTKPEGWSNNVTAITDGTNTIPLPKEFEVSTNDTEDSIEEGLVIKDGANEFVWVPVTNAASYAEDDLGPLTGTQTTNNYVLDSQEQLNYYYGTGYNYSDFTYETDKTNIEDSIKTYGGFYVGRYETTYDSADANGVPQGLGVKLGKNVLLANNILQAGINEGEGKSGKEYYYRWWGLYKEQKDMYAENEAVGSLMITSKQWEAIISFTGYGRGQRGIYTYTTKPDKSGSAYVTDPTQYDVSKNIYDLAGNAKEWTLTVFNNSPTTARYHRGGGYSSGNDLTLSSVAMSPYGTSSSRCFRF